MTEMVAVVYQRGHWFVSCVSEVRIMWNITTCQDYHCCPYSRHSYGYSLVSALLPVSPDTPILICIPDVLDLLVPPHYHGLLFVGVSDQLQLGVALKAVP
jgi:hypothetical protein